MADFFFADILPCPGIAATPHKFPQAGKNLLGFRVPTATLSPVFDGNRQDYMADDCRQCPFLGLKICKPLTFTEEWSGLTTVVANPPADLEGYGDSINCPGFHGGQVLLNQTKIEEKADIKIFTVKAGVFTICSECLQALTLRCSPVCWQNAGKLFTIPASPYRNRNG